MCVCVCMLPHTSCPAAKVQSWASAAASGGYLDLLKKIFEAGAGLFMCSTIVILYVRV